MKEANHSSTPDTWSLLIGYHHFWFIDNMKSSATEGLGRNLRVELVLKE